MLLDDKYINKIDERLLKSAKNLHCIQIWKIDQKSGVRWILELEF